MLEDVAARYRGSGDVVVLGIDVQDLREKALGFIERHRRDLPVAARRRPTTPSTRTRCRALPETFVIDREGRIALKVAGQLTQTAQLTNAIEQIRAEAP